MSLCKVWSLQRYARMVSADNIPDEWEYFDNKDSSLEFTLTSSHQLLLHHGKKQMESLCIADSRSWIKGVSKGDSVMIFIKLKDQSRRFRIKFSSDADETAQDVCRKCVELLSQYFQIKIPVSDDNSEQNSGTQLTLSGQTVLVSDVTLGQIAEAVTNTSSSSLPAIYSHLTQETSLDLDTIIKLCLTDPTFPAFVESVERHLEAIKQEYC